MEIWGTLSSRKARWGSVEDLLDYNAVRVIAKGDLLRDLSRSDAWLSRYLASVNKSGIRLYLDLPGRRLRVVDTVSTTDLFRRRLVRLVDASQGRDDRSVRVEGLTSMLEEISYGASVSIADGAVTGTVTKVVQGGLEMTVEGSDRLDLHSRSVAISGVSPKIEAPTADELELVRLVSSGGLFTGVLCSFAESRDQLVCIRDAAGSLEVVPKIESPLSASEVRQLVTGFPVALVGRSDLLVQAGPVHFTELVSRTVKAIHDAGARPIIGSGVAESLLRGPTLDPADLSDIAYLRFVSAAGLMVSGSVSELHLARAGKLLRQHFPR